MSRADWLLSSYWGRPCLNGEKSTGLEELVPLVGEGCALQLPDEVEKPEEHFFVINKIWINNHHYFAE